MPDMIIVDHTSFAKVEYKGCRYARVRTSEFTVQWFYIERNEELSHWSMYNIIESEEELEIAFQKTLKD